MSLLVPFTIRALAVLLMLVVGVSVHAAEFDHRHTNWQKLLQQVVKDEGADSTVDYTAIKAAPGLLQDYVSQVQNVSRKQYDAWSRDQRLAFLINAYNALTVKLVVDHYPVASIKDIGSFFRSAWKQEFFTLLGAEHHLDYIEHEMIRGDHGFAEARIHFALVCASVGCPKLSNRAYLAASLDKQLDEAARVFLRDERRNRYQAEQGRLLLSSIFKWYQEDFEVADDQGREFIARYMSDDPKVRQQIRSAHAVEYLDYDWRLNDSRIIKP